MKKSESTIELAKALAKFQSEIKDPSKSGKANYGKYVTLDELLESIRPVLSQNGLSFLQFPGGDGQLITITTVLLHSSGEWIESEPFTLKPQKVDPQGAGSAVTYGRRYSLSAILGVAWDADDDGTAASRPASVKEEKCVKFEGAKCFVLGKNGWQNVEEMSVEGLKFILSKPQYENAHSCAKACLDATEAAEEALG